MGCIQEGLFNEIHNSGKFLKSLNSTFIVLIAKVRGASNVKEFELISFVGCVYKLIAKVLVRRMAKVLNKVIGEAQHAFVSGRQILDAGLITNEVVDDLVNRKKEGILCKLDMEKAYDYLNWGFVDYVLSRMGFGNKWRKWMEACMSTALYAVMINCGPSSFFNASRGLR